MSRDPLLDDLIRGQRGSRRRVGVGMRLGLALLMCLAGGGATWQLGAYQDEEEWEAAPEREAIALQVATNSLHQAIVAGRLPLAVEAAEQLASEQDTDSPAQWVEGKATSLRGKLAKNESVFAALQKRGLSNAAIHEVVHATSDEFNFRHSRPGDRWEAQVNESGQIETFRYQTSPEDIWETSRQGERGAYRCHKVEVPVEVRREVAAGVVSGSLWQSMEGSGVGAAMVGKFIDVFSHDINFGSTTQPGDRFALVYEKIYLDNKELRDGRVIAARYQSADKTWDAIYYEGQDEERGYYDPQGRNVQREFLKNPLSNVRITSRFGRRFHPVLKRWKMHSGIDYGAPTGMPVMAVADGKVVWSGYKGANGKLVSIRHANGYTTHYAHLSVIPSSVKRGAKVTRKTMIGRVGSTGRSTGPHLHFGVSKGGRYVDPLSIDLMRAPPLRGKELEAFVAEVAAEEIADLDEALGRVAPVGAGSTAIARAKEWTPPSYDDEATELD